MSKKILELNIDDAVKWIAQKTGLDKEVVELVLEHETVYLFEKGFIEKEV